ncbi:MAG: NAD-dependent epimerase/dehydratase family protein [Gammaproteobacteria bacterium]|nr:MAG: NAD-dependent epimerase/dehydratase family protein [Gammaproteobacteria bacterium]
MKRIALFGGTGFVGSYLVDALVEAGMAPVALVRPGHEARLRHPDHCEMVPGDVENAETVDAVLRNADAAIYNIGLLREFPSRGITFEAMHYEAPVRIMQAAEGAGVRRFVLMSANGVRAEGTAYQVTKFKAEEYLKQTRLDWTVFRPSVIFGDPRGRNEFATQLARDVVVPPLPAPLFFDRMAFWKAGEFALSPVHVTDVAQAFVQSLARPDLHGRTLPLGGPQALSWREILRIIADALGRRKMMLPVPAAGVSGAAALLDRFESFPLTRDQLKMLLEGNICSDEAFSQFGIAAKPFDSAHLGYLKNL